MNRETLLQQIKQGQKLKYLFFWGHTQKQEGQIDKSCLSQWYPAPFTLDNVRYPTAEHYMMAEKARLFNDEENLYHVLQANHPGEAKKYGRLVRGFDETTWHAHRYNIVVQANQAKFSQNTDMGIFLLSTNEQVLVEASPYDKVWGIGLMADSPQAQNPAEWHGLNLLGFALMQVRQELSE